MYRRVWAVDFDGTLCENHWPDIGKPNIKLIERLKDERAKGVALVLWTCREDKPLAEAIKWCAEYGLFFDAVNDNVPERTAMYGCNSRKVSADLYIDDRATTPAWVEE